MILQKVAANSRQNKCLGIDMSLNARGGEALAEVLADVWSPSAGIYNCARGPYIYTIDWRVSAYLATGQKQCCTCIKAVENFREQRRSYSLRCPIFRTFYSHCLSRGQGRLSATTSDYRQIAFCGYLHFASLLPGKGQTLLTAGWERRKNIYEGLHYMYSC